MRYLIQHLEITRTLPRIRLGDDEHGVELVLRHRGRFVGALIVRRPPGSEIGPGDLGPLVLPYREAALATRAPEIHADALPSLTIAVCTRDRPERLDRCLRSLAPLLASPHARALRLDALVVDNAPGDDRTRAVVAAHPGVRYVREPRPGLDIARNRALREARTAFVAFFDDDVVVDERWLDGFVEAVTEHPDTAAVSGPVLAYELATTSQVLMEEWGGLGHRCDKKRYGSHHPSDAYYPCRPGTFGTGCNLAVRRDVVTALGGFDEALDTGPPLPGGGDLDMLYRIVRAGHPVVTEPQCLVFHEHRRDHAAFRRQMWTWGLGYMAFVQKTYATDRAQRATLRRLIVRWFRNSLANVAMSLVGRGGRPVDVAVAQLAGGVTGLCGGYGRSVRRIRRLVAGHEAPRGAGVPLPAALEPGAIEARQPGS